MRPIKFRAWDNEIKEMLEMVTVACHRKDPWPPLYIADGIINGIDHQDYVLMQYTGLKDKNGKEIYEGDIYDTGSRKFVVKYEEERAGYFPFAKDDGCGCCSDELVTYPYMGEVIGNIYEDKHLLKEESK